MIAAKNLFLSLFLLFSLVIGISALSLVEKGGAGIYGGILLIPILGSIVMFVGVLIMPDSPKSILKRMWKLQ